MLADLSRQAEPFRASTQPFAGYTLAFIVIVTNPKVFFKIFLGILQVELCFGRDHATKLIRPPIAFCARLAQSNAGFVVNYGHE